MQQQPPHKRSRRLLYLGIGAIIIIASCAICGVAFGSNGANQQTNHITPTQQQKGSTPVPQQHSTPNNPARLGSPKRAFDEAFGQPTLTLQPGKQFTYSIKKIMDHYDRLKKDDDQAIVTAFFENGKAQMIEVYGPNSWTADDTKFVSQFFFPSGTKKNMDKTAIVTMYVSDLGSFSVTTVESSAIIKFEKL